MSQHIFISALVKTIKTGVSLRMGQGINLIYGKMKIAEKL